MSLSDLLQQRNEHKQALISNMELSVSERKNRIAELDKLETQIRELGNGLLPEENVDFDKYVEIMNNEGYVELPTVGGKTSIIPIMEKLAQYFTERGYQWNIYAEENSLTPYEESPDVKKYFYTVQDFKECTYCNWDYIAFEMM